MATSSTTANFYCDDAKAATVLANGVSAIMKRAAPFRGKAILFGSRARGDAGPDSDWDVLILLDKEMITATDQDTIAYPIHEIGWKMDEMVNPVMYTVREWESKKGTPFYENVKRDGVSLWT